MQRCSGYGMFLGSSAIAVNDESSKQKHAYGDVAATVCFLGVTPPAEMGRVKGKETAMSTRRWYDRGVQTVKTGLSLVRKSPFRSMVPMMSELSNGGVDPAWESTKADHHRV